MTGEPVRRTTHAHVHFLRAGFAEVHPPGPRRRSANNRIVHYHDSLTFHRFLDQVELHPDVEVANELAWLEKGPADVVIAHESVFVGQVKFMREPERRVVP